MIGHLFLSRYIAFLFHFEEKICFLLFLCILRDVAILFLLYLNSLATVKHKWKLFHPVPECKLSLTFTPSLLRCF